MADALSQEQIDAMLQTVQSGGTITPITEQEEEIKEYDFRAPKKFTRERIKAIHNIFDNYARLLSSYLTGLLRLYCKVSLVEIDETRYFDFNNALPDYVMMGMVDLELRDDEVNDLTAIIQLSNSLTFIMIDRLLGGRGEYKDSDRDFTEIEVTIMENVISNMAGLLREPWESYVEINPKLEIIETNARVVSNVGYDDTMILCVLEIVVSETKTLVTICMPALGLDEIMQKFSQKATTRAGRKTDVIKERERKENILSTVSHTQVDITAILGKVNLDMYDIINLQMGDIIPLGKSIDSNITVNVGGNKWFDGKLGTFNSNKAVKIENIFGMNM